MRRMENRFGGASFWRLSRRRTSFLFFAFLLATIVFFYTTILPQGDFFRNSFSRNFNFRSRNGKKFAITDRVAVITETRALENLVPLILHFSKVLGPTWPIILYTYASTIPKLQTGLFVNSTGPISVRPLPNGVTFLTHKAVSTFLTTPWFWKQLAPAEHVLLFQSDSIICQNAPQRVEDYFQWDFVGAPIKSGLGQGYNGGLSLRNRKKFLEIVRNNNFEEAYVRRHAEKEEEARMEQDPAIAEAKAKAVQEKKYALENGTLEVQNSGPFPYNWFPPDVEYEDQWFFQLLLDLPPKKDGGPGARLPGEDIAKTFSVETVLYNRPLGFHQVGVVVAETKVLADNWCPEWRLCTNKLLPAGNKEGEHLNDE